MMLRTALFLCLNILIFSGSTSAQTDSMRLPDMIKRFAPVNLTADTSKLSSGDRNALRKLIPVVNVMDKIYLFQAWKFNPRFYEQLLRDTSKFAHERFHYFKINMGPWSRLDNDEPFIKSAGKKPAGANYYPPSLTKEELEKWLATEPESTQIQARGFYHLLRRNLIGQLKTVPYSKAYGPALKEAVDILREAADAADNRSLKNFLRKRADAFISNDYYESEIAWMNLDSPIEPTIGPYEVYMDELFNYKAAFEAYITLRDDDETKKLEKYSDYLQEIENNLPIDPRYRNPKLGSLAPIRVVNEVAIGGEARAGVQTAAFNLPNDERITKEMGSKRVLLKNVQEAKFQKILTPIAAIVLDSTQLSNISFEPFFTHILAHELMHGLGPHNITVNGKETTVRQEMGELSSALEEAKADISGLFALQYLIDKGVVDKSMEEQLYTTYLAGIFRSVRFGINEAHGKGMITQFNYLLDQHAFLYDSTRQTFSVNPSAIKEAVKNLTAFIMTIQAEGNHDKAAKLFEDYALIRPQMQAVLNKLKDVPVDIDPRFPLAGDIPW